MLLWSERSEQQQYIPKLHDWELEVKQADEMRPSPFRSLNGLVSIITFSSVFN